MLSEQLKDLQLSIYDFIESQEFPPSETVPQVDETQDSHELPSSALDTRKNWEIVQDSLNEFFEKPTEDTDLTLFSVGDILTVKDASDVYSYSHEFYDYLKGFKGEKVMVLGVKRLKCNNNVSVKVEVIRTQKEISFYDFELQK